ncbi:AI-2E family transporter [Thalassoglobus sp. JC818]|uniref:AI-2E family transporter n=1 Tax=Thalassoglobus sp. JC818 TaxID=3232136 RepID=UPI0034599661
MLWHAVNRLEVTAYVLAAQIACREVRVLTALRGRRRKLLGQSEFSKQFKLDSGDDFEDVSLSKRAMRTYPPPAIEERTFGIQEGKWMASMRRKVSLGIILLLIVAFGIALFKVVAPFFLPLFLAGMTAVVCQPLFRYFLMRTSDREQVAAGLTTGVILAAILIPLVTAILIGSLQLYVLAAHLVDDQRLLEILRGDETVQVDISLAEQVAADDDPATVEGSEEVSPETSEAQDDENETAPSDGAPSVSNSESTDEDAAKETATPPTIQETVTKIGTTVGSDVKLPAGAGSPIARPARDSFFDRAVAWGNSWLPPQMKRSPESVAEEIRHRVWVSIQDLGNRSLGRAAGTTFGVVTEILGVLVSACIGILMFTVALYYFLSDGSSLIEAGESLIPVHAKYQRQLMEQFALVVRSVVVATFLAAFAQGLATTLALWVLGFPHIVILFLLATFSALVPMLGTWLVWLPCAIALFSGGHWIQGILLTVYGAVFVGFLDNVIRTYLLNSDTKLHPLLAFISILGGLQTMGLWGVFIGPIIASCLHALIKIFNHELVELNQENETLGLKKKEAVASTGSAKAKLPDEKGTSQLKETPAKDGGSSGTDSPESKS